MSTEVKNAYARHIIENRKKINKLINYITLCFVAVGPIMSLIKYMGMIEDVTYGTCFYASISLLMLSGSMWYLRTRYEEHSYAIYVGLISIGIILIFLMNAHLYLAITFVAVPLFALFYSEISIYIAGVIIGMISMSVACVISADYYAGLYKAASATHWIRSELGGYLLEYFSICIVGYFLCTLVVELQKKMYLNIAELEQEKKEKQDHLEIEDALSSDYENVYIIDWDTDIIQPIRLNPSIEKMYGEFFRSRPKYQAAIGAYIDKTVLEEDKAAFSAYLSKGNILAELDNSNSVEYNYRAVHSSGVHYCKMKANRIRTANSNRMVMGFADVNEKRKAEIRHNQLLLSFVSIYMSAHYFNLKTDVCETMVSTDLIEKLRSEEIGARKQIINVFTKTCSDAFIDKMLDFINFDTLSERMKNCKYLSLDFYGLYNGWCKASFIKMNEDEDGNITEVIFVTREINASKLQEEKIIKMSFDDELTGLKNRRAYGEELDKYKKEKMSDDFVAIVMDINGLKSVNDNYGHIAGDELIKAAAAMVQELFGKYGNCYRVGGDEFYICAEIEGEMLGRLLERFDARCREWKGQLSEELRVSYGYAGAAKYPELDLEKLMSVADKKMYENKQRYYEKNGIERRKV